MTAAVTLADNASLMTTPTGTAPSYLCRAWVNFNGTGTVAIRASGNVSSITDNGTGDYTVNFATALTDASYSFVMHCIEQAGGDRTVIAGGSVNGTAPTTSALNFNTFQSLSSTRIDANFVTAAIFR